MAKYIIVTDLKHSFFFGRIVHKIKSTVKLLNLYARYYLYILINKKEKIKKNKFKIARFKRNKGYKLCHISLIESLVRGFNDLGVPFEFNKFTKDTKNAILCGVDRKDLKIIDKLKKSGKLEKVVATPVATGYDDGLLLELPEKYDCVDLCLIASEDARKYLYKGNPNKKLMPWASGVKMPKLQNNSAIEYDCICYYKKIPVNKDLENLLNSKGIKFKTFEYSKYYFEDWEKSLDKVNFVIFYQDFIETQGLAMCEVWAYNRPTLIKTTTKTELGKRTSPYLVDKAGLYFETLEELNGFLTEYVNDKNKFLSKFSPRKYAEENFSDKGTVEKLIEIFDNIK